MVRSFDVLPCGYVSFTDDGVIVECNQTLAGWLDYTKEDLAGKSIERIFTLATRIFYNTHFFPLIRLHAAANEIFLTLKDRADRDIPVLANAQRITDGADPVNHCVFIRVEERKKFEQELVNAKREAENALKENKQLSELSKSLEKHTLEIEKHYQQQIMMNENLLQFSKIISHDLQEPIHKVQVFMDMIINDPDTVLSTKSKAIASRIEAAAQQLKVLTNSLEEYITIDKDKSYSEVDLNAVIETAGSRATSHRQFADFEMHAEKLPTIEGYAKQMELLFFHLIDNAIQFRDTSRKLVINISHVILEENIFRVSKDKYRYVEHIRITFEDNGIGFPEEYKEYVFQLLKKVESSSTGIGLGLPLVKRIVQNHSGHVQVNSQPGRGTRFDIELPLKVKPEAREDLRS